MFTGFTNFRRVAGDRNFPLDTRDTYGITRCESTVGGMKTEWILRYSNISHAVDMIWNFPILFCFSFHSLRPVLKSSRNHLQRFAPSLGAMPQRAVTLRQPHQQFQPILLAVRRPYPEWPDPPHPNRSAHMSSQTRKAWEHLVGAGWCMTPSFCVLMWYDFNVLSSSPSLQALSWSVWPWSVLWALARYTLCAAIRIDAINSTRCCCVAGSLRTISPARCTRA